MLSIEIVIELIGRGGSELSARGETLTVTLTPESIRL